MVLKLQKKRLAEVHNLEQIHEQRMKEIQESNANFQKQLRQVVQVVFNFS